jgi:hypothetical protein
MPTPAEKLAPRTARRRRPLSLWKEANGGQGGNKTTCIDIQKRKQLS